ncbi:MAG: DUF58 domain-containing protein [Pseudomonadota bacterium]
MVARLRGAVRERYRRWLDRRIPRQRLVTLDQRRIFIFPGGRGLLFIVVLFLLFLGGINYANNQILLLCFLLASLGHTSILHTYRNMSGLRFEASRAHGGFAGEAVDLEIIVSGAPGRAHRGILLRWGDAAEIRVDIEPDRSELLRFSLPVDRRGRFVPPRIAIRSFYPLGIVRTWSYVALDMTALVYPQPVLDELPPSDDGSEEAVQQEGRRPRGIDEFEGLSRYVPGDAQTRIEWRVYARTDELYTKHFTEPGRSRLWLDFTAWPQRDVEARLSRLCYWAIELERREQPYGLRLPGTRIEPAQGGEHHRQVLSALALFPALSAS